METTTSMDNGNEPLAHDRTPMASSKKAGPQREGRGETKTPNRPLFQPTGPNLPSEPRQIIGRFVGSTAGLNGIPAPTLPPPTPLAIFCHEPPDSYIGGHVLRMAQTLIQRGNRLALFTRYPFPLESAGQKGTVQPHVVGSTDEVDVVAQADEYARRASKAFLQQFGPTDPVQVIGYEWASIPALTLLQKERPIQPVLSLHSLERQRTNLSSEISRQIDGLEQTGLLQARSLLIHDPATAEVARQMVPECVDRITHARTLFPREKFDLDLDPGRIKERYQIGPVDPTIVFVGDVREHYGPDLVVKAMPAVLRHHKQARLVVVGDGTLYWPLRVYTRYLLLEHAIRLPGHIQDQPLYELIRAADIIVVPSREPTPWWPILAAWAAGRPVLATHNAAPGLLEHEKDAVLCYPSENSCVWGIERILYDPTLRESMAINGRQKLEARFGWSALAEQVEELTGVAAPQVPQ